MWPEGYCAPSGEPACGCTLPCPSTTSGHTSSIVYLIFTGSVSGAFQVDVTVWFARSVIAGNDRSK